MGTRRSERARTHYQDAAVVKGSDSWRYEASRGRRRNVLIAAAPSRRYFGRLSDKWIVLAEKPED